MLALALCPNIILAITEPWTKDFLDPQNIAVIRSSVENPNLLEIAFIKSNIKKNSAKIARQSMNRTVIFNPEKRLARNERQKLV